MAHAYGEISDSAYQSTERAEHVNNYLKWLNRLEFTDWVPPALAFTVRHRNRPDLMETFFADLERLAYSMLITRAGINDRIERFSSMTKSIENRDDLASDSSVLQLAASEQTETYSVLAGPFYESLSARARSTVLLRLDALLSGGGATYDYSTVTVEHVLPQNPDPESEWVSWFPDSTARAGRVHKLGNLALLTRKKNSAASNYEFGRKKETYFTVNGISPFVMTTQVLNYTHWTAEIVDARQTELLTILEDHWRLHNHRRITQVTL
jgi:hypothetical protein